MGGGPKVETLKPIEGAVVERDHRRPIAEVASLRIDQTPGGVIVHAVGMPLTQGYFDAELVSLSDDRSVDGVLAYEFRVWEPRGFEATGTAPSREVDVALFISNISLSGVREIQVVGASNSRSFRIRNRR